MSLPTGTRLDRYEIRSLLGAGGMGEVYLARDTELERTIALKILPAELVENADRVRRFKDEAKRASALNHRYILTIYEIGEASIVSRRDGQPGEGSGPLASNVHYIAMEYLEGETLREKIYRERVPLRKLLKYLAQVAEGLAKAHAAGIVHRDLKPDNIMVTGDGYAKILDFGLAKLVEQRPVGAGDEISSEVATAVLPQHSIPGTVLGTVGYMSPEQAQGKTKEIDHRSDIFSFGCILFEAVTAHQAFAGKDAIDSLYQIVHAPAPQIRDFNPDAPEELQRIVRRCLMKDADRRYQSIRDVAIELEEIRQKLESEWDLDRTVQPEVKDNEAVSDGGRKPSVSTADETAARPTDSGAARGRAVTGERSQTSSVTVSRPELVSDLAPVKSAQIVPPARRKRRLLGLLVALAAVLVAGAIAAGAFITGQRAGATPPPSYQRLTFSRGTVWNARFAPDGRSAIYSARWNGQPLDIYSVRAGMTESRSLRLEDADVLAVSPSGEMAVLRNRQYQYWFVSRGTLARMPIDGGAARDILEDVQEADWSPDGTKLAVVRWVNGRNRLEYPIGNVLYETAGYISHPRVSPGGDQVAFLDHQAQGDNRGWVAVVDLAGKKTVLSGEWGWAEGLAWSPDGNEVWFTAGKQGEAPALYAVTLLGKERLVLRTPIGLMLHDISRDGRVLITSYNTTNNTFGQAPGETRERDLSWLDQSYISDLSADGKTILLSHQGEGSGINYAVYLRRTDGSPAVRIGDGASPVLSPDGKWTLAVHHTPPQLMLYPTGAGEARPLERGPIEQYLDRPRWFPDGRHIAFVGREPGHDWRSYMQSVEGGPPRPVTPEGTMMTGFISPDGRLLSASNAQGQHSFYPVDGGAPQPIPNLEGEDTIIGWSSEGRSLYVARRREMPIRVYRLDPATGRKELLREIIPADPAGVFGGNATFMTPDGRGYAYTIGRDLTDLHLVEGLR